MTSGTAKRLNDIWGTASQDIFAVGDDGTIRHCDGATWSSMFSPTNSALQAVWGSGPGSLYAVGSSGAILHYRACLLDIAIDEPSFGEVNCSPEPTLTNPLRYAPGTEVLLTAVPKQGKRFGEWQLYDPNHPGDANYMSTDHNNPVSLVMDTDREVVAVFKCGGPVESMLPLMLGVLGLFLVVRRRR
jgi:hypothetical protein